MYKYIFINIMCKWEWPFVFTETRANKYPLRTEASILNLYLLNVFISYLFQQTDTSKQNAI